MSEAMAAPECDHLYVSHLHRGMYVRVCNLCNQPDWDDLAQQFADVRAEHGERGSQAILAYRDKHVSANLDPNIYYYYAPLFAQIARNGGAA